MDKYIDIDNDIFKVKKFNPDKKCRKGYAYMKGDFVYPYKGSLKESSNKVGIYKREDGTYKFIKPMGKNKVRKYHKDNLYDVDLNSIDTILNEEGINDLDMDVILGETNDVFAPRISDEDNSLQRLIKLALQKKQIDIKNYLSRFRDAGDLSNHKRALLHHGKMSLEKFIKWCNVLDLDYEVILRDIENAPNPMGEDITSGKRTE